MSWRDSIKMEIPNQESTGWKSTITDDASDQEKGEYATLSPEQAKIAEQKALEEIYNTQYEPAQPSGKPSTYGRDVNLKSMALGAVQGLPLVGPYADEAEAAIRSAVQNKPQEEVLKEIRTRYKEAEKEDQPAYLTGQMLSGLVGGGAALKGLSTVPAGAGFLSKLLSGAEIAQSASTPIKLAANVGLTAATAAPVIAAQKYGLSEKQGMEALEEAVPTPLEVAMAPAAYLGIKGISNIPLAKDAVIGGVKKVLGKPFESAKKLTEDGVELVGAPALQKLSSEAEESAQSLRTNMEGTFEDSAKLSKEAKNQQLKQIAELEQKQTKLADVFKKDQELQKKIQLEQNEQKLRQLEIKRAELGQKTEKFLDDSRKKISQSYDNIDSKLNEIDFKYNPNFISEDSSNNSPLGNFINAISEDKTIAVADKQRIIKDLNLYNRPLDQNDFRQLKKDLEGYKSYQNSMNISRAAKKAYSELNKDLADQLKNSGLVDLSQDLKKVNDQYSAFLKYDDTFTGKGYDVNDLSDINTLKMLKQFGGKSAEDIRKTQDVAGLLQRINPEDAKSQLKQMAKFSQEFQDAKDFTPTVPQTNPELSSIKNLLEQVKGNKSEILPTQQQKVAEDIYGQLSSTPLTATKEMDKVLERSGLQEIDKEVVNSVISQHLNNPESALPDLKNRLTELNLSPSLVDNLTKKAEALQISRLINLKKSAQPPKVIVPNATIATQQLGQQAVKTYGGVPGVSARMGVFAGRSVKDPKSLYNYYDKVSAPVGRLLRKIAEEPDYQKRAALMMVALQRPDVKTELIDVGAIAKEDK